MLDPITKILTYRSVKEDGHYTTRPLILMYHGTPPGNPSSEYSIRADRFAEHLKHFKRNGWHTILFRELVSDTQFPPKTVVLTFDDGYASNYDGAFLPILGYGMKATWFITTDCIGDYANWMGERQQETRMLDTEQLKKMAESGMEIASHTCSHPDLSSMIYDRQLEEMKSSKQKLEALLQNDVVSFAYPFGKYSKKSIEAARSAGYSIACTTSSGSLQPEANPMLLPRITIFRNDSVSDLARKLIFVDNHVPLKKVATYYLKRAKYKLLRR